MKQYDLIIFDWDGTLMDSIARIVSSMQAAAVSLSMNAPDDDQVKNVIGLSLPKIMEILFPLASKQQADALIAQYKLQYQEKDTTPTPLFNNALPLLTQLHNSDKLLAIATGKGRKGLERVLKLSNTQHFFHTSRCSDEAKSKPDPQMLQSILDELSMPVERAIMIGDSSHDLDMARRAGMASIGVTYGVHKKAILAQYQPKAIVDSLTELQSLLLGQSRSS